MHRQLRNLFIAIGLSGAFVVQAQAATNIREYARGVIQAVRKGAEGCGLSIVDAPQGTPTPADYLILNQNGAVIAHVLDEGHYFAVKSPLGGNVHWLEYSMEWFGAYTFQGKVAGANRFTSGYGWQFNYYCRSVPVTGNQFDACIANGFVNVLVTRLCSSR